MFWNPGFELLPRLELGLNPGFELVEPRFSLSLKSCSNPGVRKLYVESGVLELYVRTLVRELYVEPGVWRTLCSKSSRTAPPPPESSNPGFGNSMFEPGVWRTLCWNPGSGSPSPPSKEFEPWVRELYVESGVWRTLLWNPGSGTPPSNCENAKQLFSLHA